VLFGTSRSLIWEEKCRRRRGPMRCLTTGSSTSREGSPPDETDPPPKWQFIVSSDESWCYMSHVNARRKIYCKFRGKESPQSFLKYWKQKKPKGVMFVAEISSHRPTAFRFVPPNTKVNSAFYINKVLRPIYVEDIPRFLKRDAKQVALHYDSASSHTSSPSIEWLE
jgi:hypothetical protein